MDAENLKKAYAQAYPSLRAWHISANLQWELARHIFGDPAQGNIQLADQPKEVQNLCMEQAARVMDFLEGSFPE